MIAYSPEVGGLLDWITHPVTAAIDAAAGGPQKRRRTKAALAAAATADAAAADARAKAAFLADQQTLRSAPVRVEQLAPTATASTVAERVTAALASPSPLGGVPWGLVGVAAVGLGLTLWAVRR